jgi:hypothetical protein
LQHGGSWTPEQRNTQFLDAADFSEFGRGVAAGLTAVAVGSPSRGADSGAVFVLPPTPTAPPRTDPVSDRSIELDTNADEDIYHARELLKASYG